MSIYTCLMHIWNNHACAYTCVKRVHACAGTSRVRSWPTRVHVFMYMRRCACVCINVHEHILYVWACARVYKTRETSIHVHIRQGNTYMCVWFTCQRSRYKERTREHGTCMSLTYVHVRDMLVNAHDCEYTVSCLNGYVHVSIQVYIYIYVYSCKYVSTWVCLYVGMCASRTHNRKRMRDIYVWLVNVHGTICVKNP